MTDAYAKYEFDRVFAEDGRILRDGERVRRLFTEAEAQALAEDAAAKALEDETLKIETAALEALHAVSAKMQLILTRLDAETRQNRDDAARLAMTAAETIAGAALSAYGEETVAACVAECLEAAPGEPRLTVRVAPALEAVLAERLAAQAERHGFSEGLAVRADPEIAHGDCLLEWRSGTLERSAATTAARLTEIAERWLARPDDPLETAKTDAA